jgi:hypothetical protein
MNRIDGKKIPRNRRITRYFTEKQLKKNVGST